LGGQCGTFAAFASAHVGRETSQANQQSGSTAQFNSPNGVAVDSAGNVNVADFCLRTIRKGFPALMIANSGFSGGQSASISQGQRGSWRSSAV
jgi:hypothetical protein